MAAMAADSSGRWASGFRLSRPGKKGAALGRLVIPTGRSVVCQTWRNRWEGRLEPLFTRKPGSSSFSASSGGVGSLNLGTALFCFLFSLPQFPRPPTVFLFIFCIYRGINAVCPPAPYRKNIGRTSKGGPRGFRRTAATSQW